MLSERRRAFVSNSDGFFESAEKSIKNLGFHFNGDFKITGSQPGLELLF